jgi:peroxiredoxin Q/BCP
MAGEGRKAPMIEIGSEAPDFESVDSTGAKFRLSSLRGKKVILYFFPKAFTGGCTVETKQFAELAPALAARGAEVVGISVDPAETQTRFAEHCHAPFPIVSDPSKAIARSYGVLSFLGVARRVTFIIDETGVVRDVVASLLPGPHLSRARERFLPAE